MKISESIEKNKVREKVKKIRIYHPIMLALFPLLAFYSGNKQELSLEIIIAPFITVFIFSYIYYSVLKLTVKEKLKAGLIAGVSFIMFYSYGHIMILIRKIPFATNFLTTSPYLILIWLFLFCFVSFFILRSKKSFTRLTEILNVFSIALIIVVLADIGYFELSRKPWSKHLEEENKEMITTDNYCSSHSCPDVYYIIVERYGNNGVLKEYFGYDNSEFISFLKDQGFAVAEKSRSNYLTTPPSLASSLSMDYLDELSELMGEETDDRGPLFEMYRDNKIWRFFKSKGYKYIFVGSYWEQGNKSKFADINYKYRPYGLSTFSRSFLETTMFYPILINIVKNPYLNLRNIQHDLSIDQIEKLTEFSKIEGPKYIFAHLFITHGPYVFDKNGKFISEEEEEELGYKKTYINTLEFANKKLKNMIEQIQHNSGKKAIIVIQADEGPYNEKFYEDHYTFNWREASEEQMKVKTGILNAYFLPNVDKGIIYPTFTPVNSFRLIFKLFFGENLPLLPDITYAHEDYHHPYKFIEITDKIQ